MRGAVVKCLGSEPLAVVGIARTPNLLERGVPHSNKFGVKKMEELRIGRGLGLVTLVPSSPTQSTSLRIGRGLGLVTLLSHLRPFCHTT